MAILSVGASFEGFAASIGEGRLRVISQYGSLNVRVGDLTLPPEIYAEMALTEIVTSMKQPSKTEEARSDERASMTESNEEASAAGVLRLLQG